MLVDLQWLPVHIRKVALHSEWDCSLAYQQGMTYVPQYMFGNSRFLWLVQMAVLPQFSMVSLGTALCGANVNSAVQEEWIHGTFHQSKILLELPRWLEDGLYTVPLQWLANLVCHATDEKQTG